ncbi:NAD-binding protein [Rhodoferax lacus]|uniref:NAD-binding protein n=1 Tax=Rhodoferax lacus TaxID=2184758 RepID=A0A3E1R5G9_9BURK|nr:Gfo/Idh/MocA family oxidoreductase [Rhodoferax lacus]RFO94619.1 NAD-binding protein [Rhodoferax lacus]
MKKVVWGVLSTAKIGWEKVMPAMLKSAHCEIRAIASRNLEKGRALADQFGIPKAYGSYAELLADPEIEAIYNPLPNHEHVPLTLAAARAGKHVLCEKPVALTAKEAEQLREVADKVHIMEAFMVRFHPQWLSVRERVRAGELGDVRSIHTYFSYFNNDAGNIRNMADIGGGALYDIGCYPIVTARFLFGCEPKRVIALVDRDPQFQTDRMVSALLDFGGGRRLDFTVSTQSVPYQRVQVCGTDKRIEIEIPFNAPLGGSTKVHTDDGKRLDGGSTSSEVIPACDMYTLEIDAFSQAVRGEIPLPYGVEDAILNMRVIDALFASEKTGAWVNV